MRLSPCRPAVVAEMQPEQQSQNINISDNIMHTTLPAEVVRNILDLTGETMWYDSVIDWKFDNVAGITCLLKFYAKKLSQAQ